MAKNKLEYPESKFSLEEVQKLKNEGHKYLFGNYVTQEEHDAYWKKPRIINFS